MKKNILFVGFGDIASRCARLMIDCSVFGVCRSKKAVDPSVNMLWSEAGGEKVAALLRDNHFDAVVLTFTPKARTDLAYQQAYVDQTKRFIAACKAAQSQALLLFVSSTGVYAQNGGEWVDETSATEPKSFNGKRLLETEQIVTSSGLPHCIVRFSGIYGPGRYHLFKQVEQGKGGGLGFTNRIHVQDCARVIEHLMRLAWRGETLAPVYLASDCKPVESRVIRRWLATKLGVIASLTFDDGGSLNKQCSNQRLLNSGYQFLHPTFESSYGSLVKDYLKQKDER